MPKAEFKQINVSKADWEDYNQTAITLSAERGKRLSIPALLREAYNDYISKL